MRSDEFIDLYKQLEDELGKVQQSQSSGGMPPWFLNTSNYYESAPADVSLCREIRNLMTHNANLGGEPIVEPSEPVVKHSVEGSDHACRPVSLHSTCGQKAAFAVQGFLSMF